MFRLKPRRNEEARLFKRHNFQTAPRFPPLLSSKLNTQQAVEKIKQEVKDCAEVDLLVDFIETTKRGVVK